MKVRHIVGIDEAGRGPLAGPVAVGAVCCDIDVDTTHLLHGIRDSKKLTPKARDLWYERISGESHLRSAVACTGPAVVDRRGIQHAIASALKRVLAQLNVDPQKTMVLMDGGLVAPEVYMHQRSIVHGDALEPLISAASVMAKVTRDRHMLRVDSRYPVYGFRSHKGYGTRRHMDALHRYGMCPEHRKTFVHISPQGKMTGANSGQ